MKEKIYPFVLRRLSDERVAIPDVARDTGLKLRWLYCVKRGEIPDPGVVKIQALADYFARIDRKST